MAAGREGGGHVRHLVLDRLEHRELLPELFTLLDVRDGRLERRVHPADHLGQRQRRLLRVARGAAPLAGSAPRAKRWSTGTRA